MNEQFKKTDCLNVDSIFLIQDRTINAALPCLYFIFDMSSRIPRGMNNEEMDRRFKKAASGTGHIFFYPVPHD